MLAARLAFSDPSKAEARAIYMEAHKTHLRSNAIDIVQSGPFGAEHGASGGLLIAEVADLAELQRFSDADPFVQQGIYATVHIVAWTVTIDRRKPS